jgi:1-acyl-sn-glycerol-3-phosphate acyltransferase
MQIEKNTSGDFFCFVRVLSSCIVALFLANAYLLKSIFSLKEEEGLEVFLNKRFSLKEKTFGQDFFELLGDFYYWVLKNLISRTVAFIWLGKLHGSENIPKEVPFLIVPNHQSYLDFLLIIWIFRKSGRLKFFIKESYFDNLFWNFFLVPMGQLRADAESIRRAMKLLREEKMPVVLFPEGKRTENGEIEELTGGLFVIARKNPALKLVPVGISGAFEAWPRQKRFPRFSKKIEISIGKPILLVDFEKKGCEKGYFLAEIQNILEQLIVKT